MRRVLPVIAFALGCAWSAAALAQTSDNVSRRDGGRLVQLADEPAAAPTAPGPSPMRPEGSLHFGLQAAFTVQWWAGGEVRSDRCTGLCSYGLGGGSRQEVFVGGEIAPFVDLRVTPEVQLRALAVIGTQTAQNDRSSPSVEGNGASLGTGFFHVGARVLVGFIPVSEVAIRIGGEIGMEVLFPMYDVGLYGGPMLEIAIRLLDQQNLEIALQLEVQSRAWRFHLRGIDSVWDGAGSQWAPREGIAVAYLF